MTDYQNSPDWREVPNAEWKAAAAEEEKLCGGIYNGMTTAALMRRYGTANVRHVPGVGWFVRTVEEGGQ